MQQYLDLLQDIKVNGKFKMDRTGVGCTSVFGRMLRFDLNAGFPLLSTKKVHLKSIIHELLWFLSGDTNIKYLKDNGVSIWDDWAIKEYETQPLSYAEIIQNICKALPNVKAEHFVVFETDGKGNLTDRVIPHEQVGMGWNAYGEIIEFVKSLEQLHDVEIPVTKEVVVAGELGPVYGKMWRAWPNDIPASVISQLLDDFKNWKPNATSGHFDNGSEELVAALQSLVDNKKPIDQIKELIDGLKNKPFSRRHIVTGWNPALLPIEGRSHRENIEDGKQALPPCHTIFQFQVEEMTDVERIKWVQQNWPGKAKPVDDQMCAEIKAGKYSHLSEDEYTQALIDRNKELYLAIEGIPKLRLNSLLFQRSCDVFLGASFNIASYALLTMMVAQVCGYVPGEFVYSLGDAHIYANHEEQVNLQLTREPRPLPMMRINPEVKDIFAFKYEDFVLENYNPWPPIKGEVAV